MNSFNGQEEPGELRKQSVKGPCCVICSCSISLLLHVSYICSCLADHPGGFGVEEPRDRVPQIIGSSCAGGGSL